MKSAGYHFSQYARSSHQRSVENGTIPASSQQSPTSFTRVLSALHSGHATTT